jgi:peptide/nickel transport system permease protein
MRNSMLEVLGSEFIELAKAKGLKTGQIIFRHAARNAMLPVITLTSIELGYAIGGQVLLETVFSWPGMGRAIVEAVNSSDYPMAQGCFIFLGAIVITMNFITDLLYLYLDPRISYSVKGQTE